MIDEKRHAEFIDEIDSINDKTEERVMAEFNAILKKSFEISGGNLNKLPLIVRRAKKLALIKAQKEGILAVRDVRAKSRKFAQEKLDAVQL